jgi:hypothetical protein
MKTKSIILQGLKLDYEIIKSLKFTSQYNGEYYTWKNYNYEDTKILVQRIRVEQKRSIVQPPILMY